jgi:ABC-2 type transport system ATP-binding protein
MITVNHLTKFYGNKLGVKDVSFHIEKGEIVGMLGPNGAGKSTIMRMLAGYMLPTSGNFTINGVDALSDPIEASRHIGYLPELPPLYMEMSVERYLEFLCQIRQIPREKRAAHMEEAMTYARILDVRRRLIKNLSKGYRQRVGIAQALIGRPEILIFDEPTVGLDPRQITEVRSLIEHLKENHTILLSSHILSEIRMTCDRVLIINQGRLLCDDSFTRLAADSTRRYSVSLKCDTARGKSALTAISGVDGVEPADSPSAAVSRFYVTISSEAGALDRFAKELCAQEIPLYELKQTTKTLEEVFLSIISSPVSQSVPAQEDAV